MQLSAKVFWGEETAIFLLQKYLSQSIFSISTSLYSLVLIYATAL